MNISGNSKIEVNVPWRDLNAGKFKIGRIMFRKLEIYFKNKYELYFIANVTLAVTYYLLVLFFNRASSVI